MESEANVKPEDDNSFNLIGSVMIALLLGISIVILLNLLTRSRVTYSLSFATQLFQSTAHGRQDSLAQSRSERFLRRDHVARTFRP